MNYAAAVVFEVRRSDLHIKDEDVMIRLRFKNGTHHDFKTYHMFGRSGDTPLSEFKAKLLVSSQFHIFDPCL